MVVIAVMAVVVIYVMFVLFLFCCGGECDSRGCWWLAACRCKGLAGWSAPSDKLPGGGGFIVLCFSTC